MSVGRRSEVPGSLVAVGAQCQRLAYWLDYNYIIYLCYENNHWLLLPLDSKKNYRILLGSVGDCGYYWVIFHTAGYN